jgi:hypothetical protein
MNGDQSPYARVEPARVQGRDAPGWQMSAGRDFGHANFSLYEQRIENLQTVNLTLTFGVRGDSGTRTGTSSEDLVARRIANDQTLTALGGIALALQTATRPGELGRVMIATQSFGDGITSMLTYGPGAQPVPQKKPSLLKRLSKKWKDVSDPLDGMFDFKTVESVSYDLELTGGNSRYHADVLVKLLTHLESRLES